MLHVCVGLICWFVLYLVGFDLHFCFVFEILFGVLASGVDFADCVRFTPNNLRWSLFGLVFYGLSCCV